MTNQPVDLFHYIGSDLSASNIGDLQSVSGTVKGQQRVLRRLLTNPQTFDASGKPQTSGDYIFHPEYGAGLPSYVGKTMDIPKITAVIRGQMLLESCVAKNPAPIINVSPINGGFTGGLFIQIQYADAITGDPVSFSFNVSAPK
ncbi:phage tail protein [Undibacterium sp. MH2W]|uniref:phage tail protein n=1 Tax=Undibacterium sp. MH2W TaxID=3413044 RepID=UPI003BF3B3D2